MSLVEQRTEGRVRILTMNRPEARNALSAALRRDLIAALQASARDDSVGAIVLTGAGSAFAAGADVAELLQRDAAQQRAFLQPPHIYSVVEDLPKPVVAAINGHALGAGLELATACDVKVCAEDAKLGQPEIHLALMPGGGGTQRLFRQIGKGAASRLVLSGDAIEGAEAHRLGLVDILAPRDGVVPAAVALAAAMARHDPVALATAKRSIAAARDLPYREGLAREAEHFVDLHSRPEARARLEAFLRKA